MSPKSIFARKSVRRGGAATMIAGGVLAATLALAPGSGAVFTDTGSGTANLNAATLKLSFGESQSFNLQYDNVKPGDSTFKTFTVTNRGSIPADVSFHARDLTVTGGNNPDLKKLSYHIEGYNPANVVASQDDPTIQLGTLDPGSSRTYELYVKLDQSAGNEWQGVKLVSNLDVTLTQH